MGAEISAGGVARVQVDLAALPQGEHSYLDLENLACAGSWPVTVTGIGG
jgi:hypothetical protein